MSDFMVALSADGKTALIGEPGDDNGFGAVWVWTRSDDGAWTQGPKLIGTGVLGFEGQGESVALSADGNTALVGGSGTSTLIPTQGAAWVWTRSGGVWTQQGPKLLAQAFAPYQGRSVALSADGDTAIVGDGVFGGAFVWTRSGGVWTLQSHLLVATSEYQGAAVALSADGNTALVGGTQAWVWTRTAGVWTQGASLFGSGGTSTSQGAAVALSADGKTALVSETLDNNLVGAVWVWAHDGGWTQDGPKLVGTGAVGSSAQGISVALAADGNTALAGGYGDDNGFGATWAWSRSGGIWTQQGSKLVATGQVGVMCCQGRSVALSGDGKTALLGGIGNGGDGAVWVFVAASPTTTVTLSPAANSYGWNSGNVTVTLKAADSQGGTAIKQIQFALAGAQSQPLATVAGDVAVVVISAEGQTTLSYFATDNAGQQENAKTKVIRVDKTPPVITGLPASGCSIWPPNRKLVQVATVSASDALSGIVPGSLTVTGVSSDPQHGQIVITGGPDQYNIRLRSYRNVVYSLTATAMDEAGNRTTMKTACTVRRKKGR